jgi:hypothetical protein
MLHAPRDNDEVAFTQLLDALTEIDGDSSAQHEEGLVFAFMRVPIELSAEFRHLDLTVVDIPDDERMKNFLNLAVDRFKNVDLGWGPVFPCCEMRLGLRPAP